MRIWGISPSDIWVADYVVSHWDGVRWQDFRGDSGTYPETRKIRSIWGRAANDVYFAGDKGHLVHWDGVRFTKLSAGTTDNLMDIWGDGDRILALARSDTTCRRFFIEVSPSGGTVLADTANLRCNLESLWFGKGSPLYVVGAGIFVRRDTGWQQLPAAVDQFKYSNVISGLATNDVFVGSEFGIVSHFNGITWAHYPELDPTQDFSPRGIMVLPRTVWIVGESNRGGLVYHGTR
jgi:hypothetical protein